MKKALILLTLSCISFAALHGQTCSDQDVLGFTSTLEHDSLEHVVPSDGGDHHFSSFFDWGCHYRSNAVAPTRYCVTNSFTNAEITAKSESGSTTPLFYSHFIGANSRNGASQGVNGATASSGAKTAGAVMDCIFSCAVTIGLDASNNGIGIKVTFPPGTLWTKESTDQSISCGPVLDPTFVPDPGDGSGVCDPNAPPDLRFGNPNGVPNSCASPIIIDTEGEGFHLTPVSSGVNFDIRGNGVPIQIAWTAPNSHNAFLALPGPDGLIHNGKELFGNFTPQPQSATPNGFLALAEYDKPENGGNSDGVIDENDAVFSKLVLWIDNNHDGISQPSELHKLSELGIHSLSVSYFKSQKTDEFGNQFRYKGRVNPRKEDRDSRDEAVSGEVGRWAYDVFLSTK